MKKLSVLVVALVAVFGATVLPAAAVPTADLTALTALFPSDTAVLVAVRTDAGYVEALDSVIDRVNGAFSEPVIPMSLSAALAEASSNMGGDFETVFGSWLGDTAVVGVDLSYALDDDSTNDYLAGLAAIQITDRAAAESFWSDAMSMNPDNVGYTVSEEDGFTIYTPNTDGAQLDGTLPFAFADDYMLLGNLDIARSVESPLSDNAMFTDAMNALPNGDYNIAIYMDTVALFEANIAMMENSNNSGINAMGNMDMLRSFGAMSGQIAIGFTIIDGRSLTIDAVSTSDMSAVAAALGMDEGLDFGMTAIDPSFAGFIPSGTPIVTHITNLNALSQTSVTALRASVSGSAASAGGDSQAALQEIDSVINGIQFAVRGATGLELNEDILSWMTGDVAIWFGLTPAVGEADNMFAALADGLPVNFGLLINASADPEKAAGLVEGLNNALDLVAAQMNADENSTGEIALTTETIGGVDVTVVTLTDRSLPFPIELVIGSSDAVFMLGTRAAAEAAFAPDGSLLDDPAFQEAAAYILPDAVQVHYLAGGGLLPLANLLMSQGGSEGDQLGAVLGLISSSSISSSMVDGMQTVRAVITFAE